MKEGGRVRGMDQWVIGDWGNGLGDGQSGAVTLVYWQTSGVG